MLLIRLQGTADFMSVEVNKMQYRFQPWGDQHGLARNVNLMTKILQNFELIPGDDDSDENDTGMDDG